MKTQLIRVASALVALGALTFVVEAGHKLG
jgi:hypothetical protein